MANMKTLEKGQDKLKRICDVLKHETLEPAKQQAEEILNTAREQAEQIILEAKRQAKKIIDDSKQAIEQERKVFHSSLVQSSQQSLEALKQAIEQKLFNQNLENIVTEQISGQKIILKLIEAIIQGIKEEGVSKDFSLVIPKHCSPEEIAQGLSSEILNQLNKNPITVGSFNGGVQVKLLDKKLTLVITEKEISDYLKQYVRKDFRKFIFTSSLESQR